MFGSDPSCQAVWQALLADCSSVLQRLERLSSLRDLHTGAYRYSPIASSISDRVTEHSLRWWHDTVFIEWLSLTLAWQAADFERYLCQIADAANLVRTWLDLECYRLFIPAAALPVERELFLTDMRLVLFHLDERFGKPVPHWTCDPRIAGVIDATEATAGDVTLSLKVYSQSVGLSAKYLGQCFKQAVGTTYRTFLRRMRMHKAALMLCRNSAPIKEVSAALGYSAVANFYRDFTRFFGVTPSQYRRSRA